MDVRLRIWHLMAAIPLMAIAAGVATWIVPKDEPFLFGLVCIQVVGTVLDMYYLGRRFLIPLYREMWESHRRLRRPGLVNLFGRMFFLLLFAWIGLLLGWITFGIANGVASLPILILYYLEWL